MNFPKIVGAVCTAFTVAGVAASAQEAPGTALPPGIPAAIAPATGPVLSETATAFKARLQAELGASPDAAAIDGFYAGRAYAPFWTEPDSDRAAALAAALDSAAGQALPARAGDADAIALLFGAGSADASPVRHEVAATRAYLHFARDLTSGVLVPAQVNEEIKVRPARLAQEALLAGLDSAPVAQVLADLAPADPDYGRLIAEKARLEALDRTASWGPEVSDGDTLHPGDTSPRVAELRGRLARLGYLVPDAELAGSDFDPELQQAVEAFQRDYGLNDDGVIGARTLDAINAPVETRLAQVAVNLERLRWTNIDPGQRYLEVNIPDFTVRLIDGGKTVWQSKVVVGKTHVTETPEFSGVVSTMVVNPTWHIPDSIAIRDYLPKLQKDPMVLKRQNIRLLTRGGTEINPKLVDFTQYTPENFPFRIKQRPSDDNALGQVKFLFPNENSVYMHDTPHRELFARDERAFSNGCIRLQKPVELAHILLTGQVPDPEASYAAWVAAKTERAVPLKTKVPVQIVYRTVWFDDAGAAHYRPDVYGRDAQVYRALEAAGATAPAAQG